MCELIETYGNDCDVTTTVLLHYNIYWNLEIGDNGIYNDHHKYHIFTVHMLINDGWLIET